MRNFIYKAISSNFYFFKILTDFRHIILQSARKLNPKFFQGKSFTNEMGMYLYFKQLFFTQHCFTVIIIHVQLFKGFWYTQPLKRRLVE